LGFGFDHLEPVLRNVEEIATRIGGAVFRKRTISRPFLRRLEPELLDPACDLFLALNRETKMVEAHRRRSFGGVLEKRHGDVAVTDETMLAVRRGVDELHVEDFLVVPRHLVRIAGEDGKVTDLWGTHGVLS